MLFLNSWKASHSKLQNPPAAVTSQIISSCTRLIKPFPVTSGIPQGSVLEPILFLISHLPRGHVAHPQTQHQLSLLHRAQTPSSTARNLPPTPDLLQICIPSCSLRSTSLFTLPISSCGLCSFCCPLPLKLPTPPHQKY